jgi:hypothetical protein
MNGLLLGLFLLGAEEPRYPLGPLPPRSLAEPGRPFVLTDLRYRATHEPAISQAFSTRIRVRNWGFLGAFVDDQLRGLSLQTHRLSMGFFQDPGFTNLQAGWRGSRALLDIEAERRRLARDGGGWVLGGELGLRLSEDVEAFSSVSIDTDRRRAAPSRTLREGRWGVLWQRGTRLDLSAAVSHREQRTRGGLDLETASASASASAQVWSSEAEAELGYAWTHGAVPRREAFASTSLRSALGGRWLAHALSRNRWEPGVRWFEHELGGGLSLHGRRVRLPRAGEAARRTLALARRATALDYNERRVHDEEGRRGLRERLALSPRREELLPELLALHRAQVAERNVPLAGIAVAQHVESVTGARRLRLDLFLGAAWPPRWPWRRKEDSVPFLTARYTRIRTRYGGAFSSHAHSAALEAELNREMSLAVRWRRPGLTPLDVALFTGGGASFEVEYVYALGR